MVGVRERLEGDAVSCVNVRKDIHLEHVFSSIRCVENIQSNYNFYTY